MSENVDQKEYVTLRIQKGNVAAIMTSLAVALIESSKSSNKAVRASMEDLFFLINELNNSIQKDV